MTPDISIIIPVYNVEKYIHQCLDSILEQKDVNFEIIAVDDGSPDSCGKILDEYAAKDNRIRVIHKENGGVSAARNTGIESVTGTWCYFVDSDDWLAEGQLAKLLRIAKKTNADIVFTDCLEQYENGSERRIRLFSEQFTTDDPVAIEQIQKCILCHKYSPFYVKGADSAYPAPWSKLIKTKLIKEGNITFDPYVGGVYDDGLFTLEILERAKKIAYSGVCVYNYRIITSSIVHAYREGMVEKFEKNCERVEAFAKRNHKDEDFMNAEYCRRIAYLSSFFSSYFFSENNTRSKSEKKQALLDTMHRKVWSDAIQRADWRYLEWKHRYCLACMRSENTLGMRFYSYLKSVKLKKVT